MTTFQAIVYAIIQGMSQFLPVSEETHLVIIPYLVGWDPPTPALLAALSIGAFFSVFIYFAHDWASMISGFLQMIIYRKKPMTLDERLPLFLMVTSLPLIAGAYYSMFSFGSGNSVPGAMSPWSGGPFSDQNIYITSGIYIALGLLLWFLDYWNRKLKGTFDWNWKDSAIVGLTQLVALAPGGDTITGILIGTFFLNYRREAAAKYAFFAAAPMLLWQTIVRLRSVDFRSSAPAMDLSWLSFSVATLVACLAGLLAIGGFMRHVSQQKGMSHYLVYRFVLAGGACAVYWYRG